MGLYQRRRPTPIKIYPNPVRRQEEESGSPDSPDSPQSSEGADSPASTGAPSPTEAQAPSTTAPPPPPATTAPAQTLGPDPTSTSSPVSSTPPSSQVPAPSATTSSQPPALSAAPPPPPPPAAVQTSSPPAPTSSAQAATSTSSSSASSSSSAPSVTARPPLPNAAIGDDQEEPDSPATPSSSGIPDSPTSSSSPQSTSQSTASSTSSAPTSIDTGPPRSQLSGESAGIEKDPPRASGHAVLGKGAEAALITSAVLGFIALLVGGWFLYKRRKRRMESQGILTEENGFAPGPGGSLATRETVQIGFDPSLDPHTTRSTNRSDTLFGGSHYQRPETVSTNTNSRAAPEQPLPTPNPFADPPRNKAFDMLRGRPRSTTLTDRGSWIKNPFRDPESDRFDPFGELQEKARKERVRYMQELKQEELDRLEREREQQFLEKERMGLGVPERARKGSGVTVEGVGVLDRSGNAWK